MREFETLKKINDNYKAAIDALSVEYEADAARDARYSDELIAQRVAERNARFNTQIDQEAQKAVNAAAPEFVKLREKLRAYITTSADPATLSTLQSLIAGGVELSSAEIAAFADGAGYAVLRLLEKPSGGHIQAPKLEALEADLKELELYFRDISAYRGKLAPIGAGGYWGRSAVVGSTIMKGQIDHFTERTDEVAARWACLYTGRSCAHVEG